MWLYMMSYLLLLSWTATGEQFYVLPSGSTSCPRKPCYTLTDIVLNSSRYFASNTVITFLPGNHKTNITREFSVLIKDVRNISMIGYDHTNTDSKSVIQCTGSLGFAFIKVTTLKIANLRFASCGASLNFKVERFPKSASRMTLYFLQTINVTISAVTTTNSTGAGLIGINMFGVSNISQTTLSSNKPNSLIIFLDIFRLKDIPPTQLNIVNSHIMFGEIPNALQRYSLWGTTGLGILLLQTTFNVHIYMDKIKTYSNMKKKQWYGNLRFVIENWECQCSMIQVKNITSTNIIRRKDKILVRLESRLHGSLPICKCTKPTEEEYTVSISDSYFAGVGIRVDTNYKYCYARTKLQNITVQDSTAQALHITRMKFIKMQDMNFTNTTGIRIEDSNIIASGRCQFIHNTENTSIAGFFRSTISFHGNVKFIENKVQDIAVIIAKNSTMTFQQTAELVGNKGRLGGAIGLFDDSQLVLGNQSKTTFLRNYAQQNGGAILIDGSTMDVKPEAKVEFIDNEAYNGGALALQNDANITLKSHSQIIFLRNHAQQNGGALYVEEPKLGINSYFNIHEAKCFLQLSQKISSLTMIFLNNTAVSGSTLYGGWVNLCSTGAYVLHTNTFKLLFNFQETLHQLSPVSSNPTRVCICIKDFPDCNITEYNVTVYPGATFQIPAVAVGQMFGTVPFSVQSRFSQINSGSPPQIKALQRAQKVRETCTNLIYTIASSNPTEEMVLTVDKLDKLPAEYIAQHPDKNRLPLIFRNLHLHIQLNPCPLGFMLNISVCICNPQLTLRGINCSVDTQKVYRQSSKWINATFQNTSKCGVLFHNHCPFDYCKPDTFDLNLENPDEQCAFNRSGTLCGACQHNLSHVFGTSACRECSSLWTLLWVPVIVLAGIALVVLLIVLNLTVSVGTINGLIFYANTVRANHATFFPPNTTNSFLHWFIAWINLDLCIETCFYNGLDAYVKTWLQFVFPFYIWFLVIMIIVLSHYFTLAARLSGRNAVQVLATLYLLSYAKLLRITITVFQSTHLEYPDNTVRKVWFYDGNVDYLKGKHIPLFIAALLLFLISLPYTAILIFIQYLQHWSSYRVLFWVKKLKPLFDAYTGPYKDKHRYWTGLLLLVRIVLFLISSMNIGGSANINLLAIIVTDLLLFMHLALAGGVYKTWHLNVIEYSFFLNLGIFSSATLYTSTVTGRGQTAVVYTSVSIAFAMFIIIVVFHMCMKFKFSRVSSRTSANLLNKVKSKASAALRKPCYKSRKHPNIHPRVTHATVELRESLLDYCSQ